jgi:hypothetical protein
VQVDPWGTASNDWGQPPPSEREHFVSVGAVISHVPLQAATVSQPWTGFEPYSHSTPVGEHDVFVGRAEGHRGAGPLSEQPPVHAPLLLPLPPPLLLPLPPPLLLLPPPLLPPCPPLLPLLPPLPLPLPPPLLLPLAPLLPAPLLLPASPSVVNAVPPHAGIARISETINELPHRHGFMTTEPERSVCQCHLRESRDFCVIGYQQKCAIHDTWIAEDIRRRSGSAPAAQDAASPASVR